MEGPSHICNLLLPRHTHVLFRQLYEDPLRASEAAPDKDPLALVAPAIGAQPAVGDQQLPGHGARVRKTGGGLEAEAKRRPADELAFQDYVIGEGAL